jgi:hypothetical protein
VSAIQLAECQEGAMPNQFVAHTWRVVAPSGIRVRAKANLQGRILMSFAVGTQFVQTGPLSEADGYQWCPHHQGFSAVQEVGGERYAIIVAAKDGRGVHLDPRHKDGIGKPTANNLGNIPLVRVNYDVSAGQGSTDKDTAFQFYDSICKPYLEANKRIIFVLTHQAFGENVMGLPVVRPTEYAAFVAGIVDQWKTWQDQIVWEIWNEPDAAYQNPNYNPEASVPLTPSEFANLLALTIRRIRVVDPDAILISGGLMRGHPGYLAETLRDLPNDIRLDGIAIHPYGQDPLGGSRFGPYGDLETLMRNYQANAQRIPLYITEWGVLDQGDAPVGEVAAYARRFLAASQRLAECAVWFGWADGMHNGYGLVKGSQAKKSPLYEVFAT